MENWLVQQLRFSAFVPAATPDLLTAIWPLISSEPAESENHVLGRGFVVWQPPKPIQCWKRLFFRTFRHRKVTGRDGGDTTHCSFWGCLTGR